jgi:RNA polymerase sigma-70 factor (sigma-E family)
MRLTRRPTPLPGGRPSEPERLPAGRTAAVTELFDVHYPQLVRMARLLVDDTETAEDVVMDAFTALYRRWAAVRDPAETYRYLRSCVLNGSRSALRRRRRTRLHEIPRRADDWSHDDLATDHDVAQGETDRAAVMQLLRALPPRQREVLVLRYFLDLSEAEIADQLRISAGSVKTHSSRGLAALARALEVTR